VVREGVCEEDTVLDSTRNQGSLRPYPRDLALPLMGARMAQRASRPRIPYGPDSVTVALSGTEADGAGHRDAGVGQTGDLSAAEA
jgi:hypothetical protein